MANGNIITAKFRAKATSSRVRGLWQWDYGQYLRVIGISGLPAATEVHFEQGENEFIVLGTTTDDICTVKIPDTLLSTAKEIATYIYLHTDGDTDGATEYVIYLPVSPRSKPSDYNEEDVEVTESYAALIQATNLLQTNLTTLNEYVEQAREYADTATEAASSIEYVATNYESLTNKPQINGVELIGNKTSNDLNIPKILFDTTANWNAQVNLISELNTVYVYTDRDTVDDVDLAGFKMGDGNAYLVDLPFLDHITLAHSTNSDVHLNTAERNRLENSVAATVAGESLIFI